MPPWRAMAMAMRDSVTVSIAAESSGVATVDAPGEPGGGVGLARDDVGVPGQEHHVVVGESDESEGIRLVHNVHLA